MHEATKDMKGNVPPLPKIKAFSEVAYDVGSRVDPFAASKIEPERKSRGMRPDTDRPREPLEAYPLESLRMVGTLFKQNKVHALIQADRTLHQVRVGTHVGQNFGVITRITETEVALKELVEDANGDWAERTSTLQLQEKQ